MESKGSRRKEEEFSQTLIFNFFFKPRAEKKQFKQTSGARMEVHVKRDNVGDDRRWKEGNKERWNDHNCKLVEQTLPEWQVGREREREDARSPERSDNDYGEVKNWRCLVTYEFIAMFSLRLDAFHHLDNGSTFHIAEPVWVWINPLSLFYI